MFISKVIGKNSTSDIILTGRYISDRHAILIKEDNRIFIEDLNSTFGTLVNGKKINKRTELVFKDKVKLGHQTFHWSDYFSERETEVNPIYLNDLFSPSGFVNWNDYKIILLIALGLLIVIPIAVPVFLGFMEYRLNRREILEIDIMQYAKPLIWILLVIAGYVFINLSQKAIRYKIKKDSNIN